MNTVMNMMDPWRFLDDLIDTSSRAFRNVRARAAGRFPPVNVYLDDNAVIVDMELPGRTAKDVDLTLESQAVVVTDRPAETTNAETGAKEEAKPSWCRRIELPFRVNAEKANAKFVNGILRVELPKADAVGAKRIAIEG